ncbi:hypothetical protein CR513_58422, partial [Mucuna pruriens]
MHYRRRTTHCNPNIIGLTQQTCLPPNKRRPRALTTKMLGHNGGQTYARKVKRDPKEKTLFRVRYHQHPLPVGWKNLSLDKYNGTTDPDKYVDAYITLMSLKGTILKWYTRLPLRSIDSFKMLMTKFEAQYAMCKPHHLMLFVLVEDESLCSFMEHFIAITMKIKDLNSEVAFHSMIMALKPDMFSNSLCKKLPTFMDELRARPSNYIQMEEMAKYRESSNRAPSCDKL